MDREKVAYQLKQIPLHNTRVSCEKIDYLWSRWL